VRALTSIELLAAAFILTAAAVATLPTVNLVFTKPKFAFAQSSLNAEWRENFAAEVFSFQKCRCRQIKSNRLIRFKRNAISALLQRGGELCIKRNLKSSYRFL